MTQQPVRPTLLNAGDTDRLGVFLEEPNEVPTHLTIGWRVSDDRLAACAPRHGYTVDELVAFRDALRAGT
jgi:hypothetical protein